MRRIAADPARHLVLVTATPHSGNEEAFRSLLEPAGCEFADLPTDLDRAEREGIRRKLAAPPGPAPPGRHPPLPGDRHRLPERLDKEATYTFSRSTAPCSRTSWTSPAITSPSDDGGQRHQRVRYWSALALLRCVSSSPAAAAATLRSRAAVDQAEDEDVDEVGRRTVLDQEDDDDSLALDFSPGSDTEDSGEGTRRQAARVRPPRRGAARRAAITSSRAPSARSRRCSRTASSPSSSAASSTPPSTWPAQLREALPAKVRVESVTGLLPPAEREARIADLAAEPGEYVLVCTDCLSEGINLQQHFNAVLHYDLAWNPTRHEQREGRVDRFGQDEAARSGSSPTTAPTTPSTA